MIALRFDDAVGFHCSAVQCSAVISNEWVQYVALGILLMSEKIKCKIDRN